MNDVNIMRIYYEYFSYDPWPINVKTVKTVVVYRFIRKHNINIMYCQKMVVQKCFLKYDRSGICQTISDYM
jgi:hypothetical protein